MNTIKTVVFDLGGVLVDLDIDRCTGAFRSLGMDAVADLINPYYPAEMIGRLEHGIISFHEACDEMRRLSGTPEVTDAQIAWAYGQFLVRIPAQKLGVRLLASRVDKHTGKTDGENCHGAEKVRRLRETYPDVEIAEFYSDSRSDSPLAELAERAYLVHGQTRTPW